MKYIPIYEVSRLSTASSLSQDNFPFECDELWNQREITRFDIFFALNLNFTCYASKNLPEISQLGLLMWTCNKRTLSLFPYVIGIERYGCPRWVFIGTEHDILINRCSWTKLLCHTEV